MYILLNSNQNSVKMMIYLKGYNLKKKKKKKKKKKIKR